MKAEDYVVQWCEKTFGGGKELGDWTTSEVMKFANDFAAEKNSSKTIRSRKLHKCECNTPDVHNIKMCLECNGIYHDK